MSVNATCYVCHLTFVREKISRVHFKEEVTCIKCHGVPDVRYATDRAFLGQIMETT